ncbi:lasso peptide biosynthesis B2 protein [Plectonema cf. radiosum LEGE 06105]|uniref:Lasso peptide biosynthesis B2 protein n=1 Tax=Plectonema cf. radiosum LEGE 06105 TaxID=945769 RepID=A0A8J7K1L4_9CYAN|nr:lasso peptide biosynthesis B2 protein [Plectonema radiosum]MBE9212007.1 lasso peptide biosynthesis B2 protein [Plectonema cf. radiosum LEGE 06105]
MVLTSIIQKTHTWRKFSLQERYLLLQALILLPLIHLSLNLWEFKRTYSLLRNIGKKEWGIVKDENLISCQILTTVNMVKIAAKYYNWATCLRKSLALWFLLRRQGIPTELQIGTRFDKEEFQAHAWVEYQGYVVGDRPQVKQYFASFENLNFNLSNQLPTYKPEIEILLCCTNIHTDTTASERIESLLQKDIDWNYLLQQACHHGVFLLLYQNLVKYYPESIPKEIQPQLQAYCQIKTARNLFLSKKLCQILELFEKNNIKAIPFKGAVLAASAYQNLTKREFCDIDLIIKQEDFSKVQDILTSQNYQPRSQLQPWGQDFKNKDDSIHIDIHWQLAPSCFPYRVDFEQLWQRCETVSILNQQVINLSMEDLLLILCLQIVKDAHFRQEKLKQVYDIAQLINNSKLNWKLVIQRARDLGSERLLLFGLGIANRLLQVEMPEELQQKIEDDLIVNLYLDSVVEQLFAKEDKQHQLFGIFRQGFIYGIYGFILRAFILLDNSKLIGKHNRYLIGHLFSYIFNPNSNDLKYVSLPGLLYILYYLVRPIRLGLKFLNPRLKINYH